MDALVSDDAASNDPSLGSPDSVQGDGSGADAPVRFLTGNPSVQQWKGKVRAHLRPRSLCVHLRRQRACAFASGARACRVSVAGPTVPLACTAR